MVAPHDKQRQCFQHRAHSANTSAGHMQACKQRAPTIGTECHYVARTAKMSTSCHSTWRLHAASACSHQCRVFCLYNTHQQESRGW